MAKKDEAPIMFSSDFYRTFSGTDTLAFIMLPGCVPVVLGSITTISYSIFRNKKPVINIGRTNINGVTRGSRIYAGTMIFTLINQHWLREVQNECPWLKNIEDLKTDELPLFDIMVVSANEYGSSVSMYIYGIDFTDEGQTVSVEDLFTENTFSFIARDVSTFKAFNYVTGEHGYSGGVNGQFSQNQRFYILDDSFANNLEDIAALEKEFALSVVNNTYDKDKIAKNLARQEMYYDTGEGAIYGDDVMEIQHLLNLAGRQYELEENGVYDAHMADIVRMYQSDHGLEPTGRFDIRTYNTLLNDVNGKDEYNGQRTAVVINRNGALVYDRPCVTSNVVDVKPYQAILPVFEIVPNEDDGPLNNFYKTPTGYIEVDDMYSSYYNGSDTVQFPNISYDDVGTYVVMAQQALQTIYPQYTSNSGNFDAEMKKWVMKLQEDNNLVVTGTIDYETWLVLKALSGNMSSTKDDNFLVDYKQPPGTYQINMKNFANDIAKFQAKLSCDNYTSVKVTTISKFANGKQETNSSNYQVKDGTTIKLTDFQNAFLYNIDYGKVPQSVELFIYPYNKRAYKWTFNIKNGEVV